ncbi:hypothetical protein K2Q16_03210 [Patescibacteria group bacterium]|nr:hypothetical protein [Patescibacteria group bacterium]
MPKALSNKEIGARVTAATQRHTRSILEAATAAKVDQSLTTVLISGSESRNRLILDKGISVGSIVYVGSSVTPHEVAIIHPDGLLELAGLAYRVKPDNVSRTPRNHTPHKKGTSR